MFELQEQLEDASQDTLKSIQISTRRKFAALLGDLDQAISGILPSVCVVLCCGFVLWFLGALLHVAHLMPADDVCECPGCNLCKVLPPISTLPSVCCSQRNQRTGPWQLSSRCDTTTRWAPMLVIAICADS